MTRNKFNERYAFVPEASYLSFPNHQFHLKGILTYSRPQVQVESITPLAEAYQEGSTVVADITYRDDQIISIAPSLTTSVNLPISNVAFERQSPTSGRLLFKVPAFLVKVTGNPDAYAPVWKSNDPGLAAEITLDSTNILATISVNESSLSNGQRYDVWFDDTHLYGGLSKNVPYQFGGLTDTLGSGALTAFKIGDVTMERPAMDALAPVVYRATGNVSFVSVFDHATQQLNASLSTYFDKSDRASCSSFDANGIPEKDRGKSILAFLASISPIFFLLPRRLFRKGQVSIIILIAMVVIFITIAAVYLSPS